MATISRKLGSNVESPLDFIKKKPISPALRTLKVVSATFLLVCFLSIRRAFVKLGKLFLMSLQNFFSFSKKSKLRIFDNQIS